MTMDGTAGNSETSLAVDWRPHLYQTTWFRGACALMGVLLVTALLRLRLNETHRRYQAVLSERNRLAREMHDTLIQGCVGVSTLLEAASTMKDASPGPIDDVLDRARAEIRVTLDEARHAVWEWRQTSADRQDLRTAVRQMARQTGAHNGFSIHTEFQGASAPLDLRAERALLLVAKEALRNVVAHAKAHNVLMRLTFSQSEVEVEIADDGCGFDSQDGVSPEGGHFGIIGMKERVQELGGRFSIVSQPDQGTVVRARFPLSSAKQTLAGSVQ
jgi:signal transduction histidine kinase